MYQQVYDPVADSLGLTSLFAAIPLTLMFVMLGVFKGPVAAVVGIGLA